MPYEHDGGGKQVFALYRVTTHDERREDTRGPDGHQGAAMAGNGASIELAFEQHAGMHGGFSFVLIHGWGRSRSDWNPVVAGLNGLGSVVSMDLRGHGGSTAGPDMLLPHVAADVSALLNRLGLTKVVLVAHSAGSEVAAFLAHQDPEAVTGLVVIDPAFGLPTDDRERIEEIAGRLQRGDPVAVAGEHFARFGPSPVLPLLPETGSPVAATPETVRNMFIEFAFGSEALHFQPDTTRFFAGFPVPVLAIYRNEERAHIARDIFATAAVTADIRVMPGGHWTHHEHPDGIVAAIAEWSAARQLSPAETGCDTTRSPGGRVHHD